MAAPASATIATELMIERGKNQVIPFLIIVQSFDKHLPLARETVVARYPDVLVDLLKTVFTKTIKICLRQEYGRFGSHGHHTALAIGDIAHLAGKGLMAFRAIFLFVLFHHNRIRG
jgi:hypothetical protein